MTAFSRILILLIHFCAASHFASAQCPDGRPSCPPPRPRTCNVTVMIRGSDNRPLKNVEVRISNSGRLRTNTRGTDSARLGCGREYSFTPKLPGYKFTPPVISRTLSRKATSLSFSAEMDDHDYVPLPEPAPRPDPPAPPCNPKQDVLADLKLGMPQESSSFSGTFSPGNSACKSGTYYDAYQITETLGGDLVEIQLDNPRLKLKIHTLDNEPVADFKGELPLSNLVYVIYRNTNTSLEMKEDYTITVKRIGLSDNGYAGQIRRAVAALGQPPETDPFQAVLSALQPPEKKENLAETVRLLNPLTQLAPKNPAAFEILGVLSLYFNRDLSNAVKLLKEAIDNGGAARFGVFQGENLDKNRSESNSRSGWLAISKGKIEFYDFKGTKPRIQIATPNIEKCGVKRNKRHLFFIKDYVWKASADFYPRTEQEVEVKEIFSLLKQYVSDKCRP